MDVTMPQLGESVTEGQVSRWLKQPGDRVERYEPLVEVITDKVNAEVPSPVAGVLADIVVKEGNTVAVGTVICSITVDGQDASEATEPARASPATAAAAATPTAPGPAPGPAAAPAAGGKSDRASPAVRRLAQEHGVDIAAVRGTGGGGRVTKKDIDDYVASGGAAAPAAVAPPEGAPGGGDTDPAPALGPGDTLVPLNAMRKAIAEHMVRSRRTSPHAWCATEVDMTGVVELRAAERGAFRKRTGADLSFVAFVVKATCDSLLAHPQVNATFSPQGIILRHAINISIAVALDDGLILPVIHDADALNIGDLAVRVHELFERARAGKLTLPDVERGTFCVNNPGTFGTVLSAPIINQPQAAIMTMEAIVKRPVVMPGDVIGIRSMMFMGMSFDHRVMDGAQAAAFLQDVRVGLEAMHPGMGIE